MSAVVLDASVTLEWCFQDEVTAATEAIFDRIRLAGAVVPALWPLEVVNGLLVGERRQRLSPAEVAHYVKVLTALPITVDDALPAAAWGSVLLLAREHRLSAYDAGYLELAARPGLELATRDARLAEAAARIGVPLA